MKFNINLRPDVSMLFQGQNSFVLRQGDKCRVDVLDEDDFHRHVPLILDASEDARAGQIAAARAKLEGDCIAAAKAHLIPAVNEACDALAAQL